MPTFKEFFGEINVSEKTYNLVGVDVLGDPKNVGLLPYGKVADKYIKQTNDFYVNVDQYVIMPNHIHFILFVCGNGSPRTSTPTNLTSAHRPIIIFCQEVFCQAFFQESVFVRNFLRRKFPTPSKNFLTK